MKCDRLVFVWTLLLLLLSTVNCSSICNQGGGNVSESVLISYDGYYEESMRRGFLFTDQIVNIEHRPNKLSDFDVIEVSICDVLQLRTELQSQPRIRQVSSNRIYSPSPIGRKLQSRRGGATKTNGEVLHVTQLLQANKLWDMGFKGQGVKVAVFDTGLAADHPHFRQIMERTDWTNEQTADDDLGHGTFVAGLIAGSNPKCPGFAPAAQLHIYKVFTKKQISYTSWFLDAFNHAILRGIHVVNLSIGGPDFTDLPFMDKVWELTANGIILISAIGNDGPQFGTLNNPADQMDVIGVGGINSDGKIARFSSRGMTTWELPGGYGRVKPDIVTYGAAVHSSSLIKTGCRALSGTSVASPVVAGAVALLLSSIEDRRRWTPSVVKQALIEGAQRLSTAANLFEQGAGRVDLLASYRFLKNYTPHITLFPSYVDFTECPYMWPFCSQPLYATGLPTIINVTILNGLGVAGRIEETPVWEPFMDENGDLLSIALTYSKLLWPWSGYLAVFITVKEDGKSFEGTVSGRINLTVTSDHFGTKRRSSTSFPLRVRIIPTPLKKHRIVWDQYRNMRYPPGYFPRDDLRNKNNPLDWNADHPHTNFKNLYQHLRSNGYHLEVSGQPLTCIDLSRYSALLIVDPEEEFFPAEMEKLFMDVAFSGLNLIIFADWFNASVVDKIRFLDENTKQWWQPETGGANVPALNALLGYWNLTLGPRVFEGMATLGGLEISFTSGTSLIEAPEGTLIGFSKLSDLGSELITGIKSEKLSDAAIFGFLRMKTSEKSKGGFVSVYGDSNCLETLSGAQNRKDCFWLMDALLDAGDTGILPSSLSDTLISQSIDLLGDISKPERIISSHFARYSKVVMAIDSTSGQPRFRPLPPCNVMAISIAHPVYNSTLPLDLNEKQRSFSSMETGKEKQEGNDLILIPNQFNELEQFFRAGAVNHNDQPVVSSIVSSEYSTTTRPLFLFLLISVLVVVVVYRSLIRRFLVRFSMVRWILRRLKAVC